MYVVSKGTFTEAEKWKDRKKVVKGKPLRTLSYKTAMRKFVTWEHSRHYDWVTFEVDHTQGKQD